MLSTKLSDGNAPTVQINDIRYHIFELVMHFLYSGGVGTLEVASSDVLELMAAASFFQLDGLLRFTEARCSEMIDIDNVVAMYIHAKVSGKRFVYSCGRILITIHLVVPSGLQRPETDGVLPGIPAAEHGGPADLR